MRPFEKRAMESQGQHGPQGQQVDNAAPRVPQHSQQQQQSVKVAASSRAVGVDVGTMFFQTAEMNGDKISLSAVRNAFVEIPYSADLEDILSRNGWRYVHDGSQYFVVGDDCMQVAKLFPGSVEIRRPLQDGVLNREEPRKSLVLSGIIESALGSAPDDNSVVCTCVSSPCADAGQDSTFHAARLKAMFTRLGWNVKVIEEGLAVILSERPSVTLDDGTEVPFSGIGMSFGAGRANCVVAYKGMQVIGMSVSRSGDWIDKQVSEQTAMPVSQVIDFKERHLDFDNIDEENDVAFALDAYYDAMLRHVIGLFSKKFVEVKSQFDKPLDVVVAGGTSMPKGFERKLARIMKSVDIPFRIGDVRKAADPRNAVCSGLLTSAEIVRNRLVKGTITRDQI